MRVAELCAGYGGLSQGLKLAGVDASVEWFAEIDEAPARVVQHHHPGIPNLGDLTEIVDPPEADIVTAGFPCQSVSVAGRRKGIEDERWLIDDVCRVARASGARWLFLENVPGLLTANDGFAMARVCAAMAREGFSRWEWGTFRAWDVGACHIRRRWFCIATNPSSVGREPWPGLGESEQAEQWRNGSGDDNREIDLISLPTPAAGNPNDGEDPDQWLARHEYHATRTDQEPTRSGLPLSIATQINWEQFLSAVVRQERAFNRIAPDRRVGGRLSPVFVEWMMGLTEGRVTAPEIGLTRAQQLKTLGNGVVPQQAARAILELCR